MSEISEIPQYFHDKTLLIIGATGLIGKSLLYKLLLTCELGEIYLLIKKKNGKTAQDRFDDLLSNKIFDKVKREKIEPLARLHLLEGDITLANLGLNDKDHQMIVNNINLIFHCGANINLNSKLEEAIKTNLLGTENVSNLAFETKNLEVN